MSLLDPLLAQRGNVAPSRVVQGVAASPGWHVIGAFTNAGTISAVLEVVAGLSVADRVFRTRIVSADLKPIDNSLITSTLQGTLTLVSNAFTLPSGTFFIQAELTGGATDSDLVVVYSARAIQRVLQ